MFEHGAKWLCADFHLHTKQDTEFNFKGDGNTFINSYVDKLVEQGIEIACITNHNKFDKGEYKELAKEGRKKGVNFYPGVEISVKEGANGIHCLIIFNEDEWVKDHPDNPIDKFLNEVFKNVPNRETANEKTDTDLMGTIKALVSYKKDFFIILAHVDDDNGLFKECEGGLIKKLIQNKDFYKYVLGFQKSRNRDKQNKYINNWGGKELALVEGSDCKSIDDIGKNNTKVFLKMGDISFYTLKYALQDFKNRVCSEKTKIKHGYIHSVSYKGGKFNDKKIDFSKNLNTLIGIRGSGKSSILETVRYVLDLEPKIDEDNYKKKLVKHVLGNGGQIIIEAYDKTGKQYELSKILNNNTSVLDKNKQKLSISINSIINNPIYFGQKDLSSTVQGHEFDLLDKLIGGKLKNLEVSKFNNELKEKFKQLLTLSDINSRIEDLKSENNDINHKLLIFKEKRIDEKVRKQTSYDKDKLMLSSMITKVNDIFKPLNDIFNKFNLDELSVSKYETEYNDKIFSEAEASLKDVRKLLSEINININKINEKSSNLQKLHSKLLGKIESLQEEFAKINREIQEDTLKIDDYIKYSDKLNKNELEIKNRESEIDTKRKIEENIKDIIQKRNEALKCIYDQYKTHIEKINQSQKELKIEIIFQGNKDIFKKDIQENFQGTNLQGVKSEELSKKFSDFVSILEDYFLNDGKKLKEIITDTMYSKISDNLKKNYNTCVDLQCPNLVKIYYHGKPLENYSIGQRASALLLLILNQQDSDVIIIDQPEDDLDNQVIYKEVIKTIKEKKQHMQFIFATHNANIPVLGDAEMVISTKDESGDDNKKISVESGSIDCPTIQRNIIEIMEGGEEAFKNRKIIYDVWNKQIKKS
ncbi:MAG TPA: hypothetical protein PLB63_06505 [Planctomycetota bacterium]|nr:hypothetical protein [Planctomycetota bacterium]HQB00709.1 hypothetical protein [Planctomycetota bacterium]